MTKLSLFITTVMAICLLGFVGCEDDGDSSRSSDNGYEYDQMVTLGGSTTATHQDGDLSPAWNSSDSKYEIILTSSTTLRYQSANCTNWVGASVSSLAAGTQCMIYFQSSQINWSVAPHTVRPSRVDIYRSECLNPVTTTATSCSSTCP